MGKSKLTEENKKLILKLSREEGYTQAALAARFDVSTRTIHRILHPDYYEREKIRSTEYQRENAEKIWDNRKKTRREYRLSFSEEKDAAVIERLDHEENLHDYIRTLVTDDIKKSEQPD